LEASSISYKRTLVAIPTAVAKLERPFTTMEKITSTNPASLMPGCLHKTSDTKIGFILAVWAKRMKICVVHYKNVVEGKGHGRSSIRAPKPHSREGLANFYNR